MIWIMGVSPQIPRDRRELDADRLNLPASFHFVGAGLAVVVSVGFCLGLLTGCTTQKSSSRPVVSRHAHINQATPFGKYDEALVEAVEKKWDVLLDDLSFKVDRTGIIVLYFHLNPNGTVSHVKITKNTVGELLGYISREAVTESAPFDPWPPDMARIVGQNYREVTITFNYY